MTTGNDSSDENVYDEIFEKIISGEISTRDQLHRAKKALCKKHKLLNIPGNSEILAHAPEDIYDLVLPLLQLKPMRTRSGVAPVAVMTSPEACPHGRCTYCPGGVDEGTAQSYTGHEPAALRAGMHEFNPYHQVTHRIEQLEKIGHPTDKIDLIIMGGTFTARSEEYQDGFIKGCFDGLNGMISKTLMEAHKLNEDTKHRCIGMTVETRPDKCREAEIARIMNQGGTRVELGVQTLDDDVLDKVLRGHGTDDTRTATALLKDAGLKVCYHLMPNLPGMSPASDLDAMLEVFENNEYRPDMLKIYPTLVIKGTELYNAWKNGDFQPYTLDETVDLIARLKAMLPHYVRIQRVQRDIPAKLIEAGVRNSNLRQMVHRRLEEQGERCNCIRCREVGLNVEGDYKPDPESLIIRIEPYDASGGSEVFISMEDAEKDLIVGFARLRKPGEHKLEEFGQPALKNGTGGYAIVRELKVFGELVPIDNDKKEQIDNTLKWQHQGIGKTLMSEAETYARAIWDAENLLVNSGVGTRLYYKNIGYVDHGHFMLKTL